MMNLFSSTAMFRKFLKADGRMLLLVSRRGADAGKTFLSFHFHCRRQSLKEGKNKMRLRMGTIIIMTYNMALSYPISSLLCLLRVINFFLLPEFNIL